MTINYQFESMGIGVARQILVRSTSTLLQLVTRPLSIIAYRRCSVSSLSLAVALSRYFPILDDLSNKSMLKVCLKSGKVKRTGERTDKQASKVKQTDKPTGR